MTPVPTLDRIEATGKTVLVRADLNVPLRDGVVQDDYRIRASLPTIEALRQQGARVVVCTHLGRPEGRDPSLSTAPVAAELGRLGGFDVTHVPDVFGAVAADAVSSLAPGEVAVLENTRFEPGEKANAPEMADGLAALADAFVLDAFGSAHRAHASTVGVAGRVRSAAGLLVEAELAAFEQLGDVSRRPYVVVLGGAKISDKLRLIEELLDRVDIMLVGGGMCFTLMAAAGFEVGGSLVDESLIDEVRDVLASDTGGKILLPLDLVVADEFAENAQTRVVSATAIPDDGIGLDIGPATAVRFAEVIDNAERLFWNGPMGVFEWEAFATGTASVAAAVSRCEGYTVVGGGDSVAALRGLGEDGKVSHVSTGGGAGLALLEGRDLPGIEALKRWIDA